MSKCDNCPAPCCRYVKMGVQQMTPDQERWARLHGIVIEPDGWAIPRPCNALTLDGKCGIYESRPEVCREFAAGGGMCVAARKRKGGDED